MVKAAVCAAARIVSSRILVALPPFILEEPLMASGYNTQRLRVKRSEVRCLSSESRMVVCTDLS